MVKDLGWEIRSKERGKKLKQMKKKNTNKVIKDIRLIKFVSNLHILWSSKRNTLSTIRHSSP